MPSTEFSSPTWSAPAAGSQAVRESLERFVVWLEGYGETSQDHQDFFASKVGRAAKSLYYKHPRLGTVAVLPMVAFSPGPPLTVPGLAGKFQLPTTGSYLVGVLSAPTNTATWSLAIPAHPSFVGLEICVQGLVLGPNVQQGYTNLFCERIVP